MLPSFHTYIWCAEVNYLPAFWPCYSVPAPIGDAASSATTHFAAASGGTTEGSLSLSQHQAGQQPGLSLSSPRSCLQQVGSAASVIKWKCWWKCILGLRSVHNLVKMVSFCVVKKKMVWGGLDTSRKRDVCFPLITACWGCQHIQLSFNIISQRKKILLQLQMVR